MKRTGALLTIIAALIFAASASAQSPLARWLTPNPCARTFPSFGIALGRCAIIDYGEQDHPRSVRVSGCTISSGTVVCTLTEYGEPVIDTRTGQNAIHDMRYRCFAVLVHHRGGLAVYVNLTTGGYPFYDQLMTAPPHPQRTRIMPLGSHPAMPA